LTKKRGGCAPSRPLKAKNRTLRMPILKYWKKKRGKKGAGTIPKGKRRETKVFKQKMEQKKNAPIRRIRGEKGPSPRKRSQCGLQRSPITERTTASTVRESVAPWSPTFVRQEGPRRRGGKKGGKEQSPKKNKSTEPARAGNRKESDLPHRKAGKEKEKQSWSKKKNRGEPN